MLMETLAEQLPQGTIRFHSRVVGIKMPENASGPSVLELHDGSTYSAKVCQMHSTLNSNYCLKRDTVRSGLLGHTSAFIQFPRHLFKLLQRLT